MGYYATQGRWIPTARAAESQSADATYEGPSNWSGAPRDARSRASWLDQRIRVGVNDGTLTRDDANRSLRSLNAVQRQERGMRHYRGRLSQRDEAYIQARLDTVNNNIRWSDGNN
jgi:hypothetical protein